MGARLGAAVLQNRRAFEPIGIAWPRTVRGKEYDGAPVGPSDGTYDGAAVLYKTRRLSIAARRAAPSWAERSQRVERSPRWRARRWGRSRRRRWCAGPAHNSSGLGLTNGRTKSTFTAPMRWDRCAELHQSASEHAEEWPYSHETRRLVRCGETPIGRERSAGRRTT